MEVKYFDETKKFDFIDNYQQFLEKCYKEFDMSEEEKKSLKIFILDDGDEMTIENETDFKDNKNSVNDNNELICILKSSGRKPKNKEENKEEVKKEKKNNKDSSERLEPNNIILGNNQILEEIKKLKEELIKKIDDEKKINKKSVQEIKALIYETNENNKKNDEENNQKIEEIVKENKNLKKKNN